MQPRVYRMPDEVYSCPEGVYIVKTEINAYLYEEGWKVFSNGTKTFIAPGIIDKPIENAESSTDVNGKSSPESEFPIKQEDLSFEASEDFATTSVFTINPRITTIKKKHYDMEWDSKLQDNAYTPCNNMQSTKKLFMNNNIDMEYCQTIENNVLIKEENPLSCESLLQDSGTIENNVFIKEEDESFSQDSFLVEDCTESVTSCLTNKNDQTVNDSFQPEDNETTLTKLFDEKENCESTDISFRQFNDSETNVNTFTDEEHQPTIEKQSQPLIASIFHGKISSLNDNELTPIKGRATIRHKKVIRRKLNNKNQRNMFDYIYKSNLSSKPNMHADFRITFTDEQLNKLMNVKVLLERLPSNMVKISQTVFTEFDSAEKNSISVKDLEKERKDDQNMLLARTNMYCVTCDKQVHCTLSTKQKTCKRCEETLVYKCYKCNKLYKYYIIYKNHVDFKCSSVKKFNCNKCSFKTTFKFLLNKHLRSHWKNSDKISDLKDTLETHCPKCEKITSPLTSSSLSLPKV